MANLTLHLPTDVRFGPDALYDIAGLVKRIGAQARVTLITEGILHEWDIIEKLRGILSSNNIQIIIYDEVTTTSTTASVEKAVELVRTSKTQVVLGMGGVKTLSIAKMTAGIAYSDETVYSHIDGKQIGENHLPYIDIPTTCRNPNMLNDLCTIVDARDKIAKSMHTGQPPYAALVDPVLSISVSEKFTASTMLDTFLQALEGIISQKNTFFSETLLLQSLKRIFLNIKQTTEHPENQEFRRISSEAGLLLAYGIAGSAQGIGNAVSQVVSGKFDIPQSSIASLLIPHIISRTINSKPDQLQRICDTIGENAEGKSLLHPQELEDTMRFLVASLRLPMRLGAFDLTIDKLQPCVPYILSFPGASYTPNPISESELFQLLKDAL